MTDNMIRYKTTFEATQNLVKTIELGHGENADLVADFTDNGVPVELSGFTARALYQPKTAWGTDNWYECPCEISGNTAIAHWGNTYDNGENAVKLFMHLSKDGKVAYPALYNIGLFATPGFTPGSIEPIQKTLDFSEYQLVNAPWLLPEDITLSTVYSDNPRFTEWVPVYYTFTVEWKESLNHWIFIFNGSEVGDSTGEWANPNATNLSFNYNGIQLEANRTRLDVGYVLGSQTDKPLQPMGDYATNTKVDEIRSDITSLESESVKSIEYTGSNKIQVKQFVHENPNAVIVWNTTGLGTMTQNIFSKTGDDGEYWTYSCFDASTNQWAWFKVYTDFEISLDFILYKSGVAYTYRTIVAPMTPDASIDVNAKNREVVGVVCDVGSTPSIGIYPPVPIEGQVIEFIIDIDNKTENNVRTLIVWNTNWEIVLEEGDFLTSYNTAEAGKITRYIFKQVGFPGATKPQLFLSRKILYTAVA